MRQFRFAPPASVDTPSMRQGGRQRLDQFLMEQELGISRSQLKRIIDLGDVLVGGHVVKAGHKLRSGDLVEVTLRPPEPSLALPQPMDLSILFEDEHIIVIDKTAGLVVHPAPGHPDGTLVNGLLAHCRDLSGIGGTKRPGIVHRLDKDTSGVMVATKTDDAHVELARAFAEKDLLREYIAVVAPSPRFVEGHYETLYGRHPTQRKKFSSRVERGKRAVTHYRVEHRYGSYAARVCCRLETGRTHQIRVHFSDDGHALVGDPMYGRRLTHPAVAQLAADLGRQALHAAVLEFHHPIAGHILRFQTEPPADMQVLMAGLSVLQTES